jgi:hypothetical protein
MRSWASTAYDVSRFGALSLGGLAVIAASLAVAGMMRNSSAGRAVALVPLLPLVGMLPWSLLTYGPLLWGHRQGWGVEAINVQQFEAKLQHRQQTPLLPAPATSGGNRPALERSR